MKLAIANIVGRVNRAEGASTPIQNVSAPVIQGNHWEEGLLYVTNGEWKGRPYIFTYQWKRDDVNIDGATLQKYTPVNADVGATITCEVTASDGTNSATITATAAEIVDMYPTKVMSYSPFAYFRLNETIVTAGATADNYEGTSARDALYKNSNWIGESALTPDGFNCVKKNGNSNIDIYAAMNSGFNGNVGGVCGWIRSNSAGDWSTGFERLLYIYVNDQNRVQISRNAGVVSFRRFGSSKDRQIDVDYSVSQPTGNLFFCMTWNTGAGANGELKAYVNGVQVGSTMTDIGTFTGSLVSTACVIGAGSTSNATPWNNCRFFDWAFFSSVLDGDDVADLATRPTGKWWYHSIKKTYNIGTQFSLTDRSFVRFFYDVDNDGERELIINVGSQARFIALKSDDTVVWDVTQDATSRTMARHPFIKNGILYATHGTTLYAINLANGSLVWSTANVPSDDLRGGNDYIACLINKDFRLYNYSNGTLANSTTLPYTTSTQTLSFGDIDGDGLDEYFTNDYAGRLMALDHDLSELYTIGPYFQSHTDIQTVLGVDKLITVLDTDDDTIIEGDEVVIIDRDGNITATWDSIGEQVQIRVLPYAINGVVICAYATDGATEDGVGLDEDLNVVYQAGKGGDRNSFLQMAGDVMWIYPNTEDYLVSAELAATDIRNQKKFLFYHVDSGIELDEFTSANIDAGFVTVAGTDTHEAMVPHIIRENEFIVGDVSNQPSNNEVLRVHQWTLEDIP